MTLKPKIKIKDNETLRNEIVEVYELLDSIQIAKWALLIAKRALKSCDVSHPLITEALHANELWQKGEHSVQKMRDYGFKIHKLARSQNDEAYKTVVRVVGHAVSTSHMKEHGLVASDYAIKTIELFELNNAEAVTNERSLQLEDIMTIQSQT